MFRALLFLGLFLGAWSSAQATACAQALASTVQVTMPDGVTLATDVWRPLFDATPRPVLLRRTPYGRAVDLGVAQALVGAGYVLVSQDVRGRGASQGVFEPFFDDKVDGKATVEWAAKQPWSTGAVATYSNSAEGIVQYMAMAGAPEGLRCAHLGMPTHDLYEGLFPGGAWRSELGTRWLTDLGAASVVDVWKSHEARDSYWDDATLSTKEMEGIDHPVFIMGGFFDIFANSEVRAFSELKSHVAPESRDDIFLILGPWTHGGIGLRGQGDLLFPEDAPYLKWVDELLEYVKWCTQQGPRPDFAPIRYYLTEVTDQVALDPADNAERMVARGEWRVADSWPPTGAVRQRLAVHADGLGGEAEPGVPVSISVDADAAVPSHGGGNLSTKAGPLDQTEVDARPDVLVLATAPVAGTVEVTGSPAVKLWVSSASTDLDVIVRLEVLTAQGKPVALTDGVRRGRFARGFDAIRPLTPGEPTLFEIALGPVAVRLVAGQALRLAISGTSSPRYEPNPNVATPLAEQPVTISTRLSLHHDREHASQLLLPVALGTLPGAEAGEAARPDSGAAAPDAGGDSVDQPPSDGPGGSVDDDGGSSTDPTPAAARDEGCGCSAASPAARLDLGGALLCALAIARRRRDGASRSTRRRQG